MSQSRPDLSSLLAACRDLGAAEAEVLLEEIEVRGLTQEGASRSRRAPRLDWTCTVRVRSADGRTGLASAAGRLPDGPAGLAAQALAAARQAEVDPTGGAAMRLDVQDRGLGIFDLRLPQISDDDRQEVVELNMEGAEGAVAGVRPVSFAYEERQSSRQFASSTGASLREESTTFSLTGTLRDGQDGAAVLTDTIESRHFADVASVPMGVDLARRLGSYRVTTELPANPAGLVIDPLAVARLLPALTPAFSAREIALGRSFLAGRLGQRVASSKMHLIDDAGLSGALRTRAFDDRGVPPMAVPLLREGVAESTYLGPGLAQARRLRPTGHERADGSLWHGNLIVRSGTRSRNMLLPEMGPLVAVADILDLAGVDLAAGRLDLPVRAMHMQGAEVVGCAGVRRLRCSIDALLDSIVDVCSDQERVRDVDACTWICQGISLE